MSTPTTPLFGDVRSARVTDWLTVVGWLRRRLAELIRTHL